MEEDKKRLENLIKEFKTYGDLDGIQDLSTYVQSIENIIKEYQNSIEIEQEHRKENGELRERVKELEEIKNINKQLDLDYVDNNYIPKSKIKEKIEELETEHKQYENEWEIKDEIQAQIDILQELLEG